MLVWLVASNVFPHHSMNHDEAVYLQQAAMVLEGQLFLDPPVEGPFRPWFFVDGTEGLYPKYTPPTAAVFAVGMALGNARVVLAVVAAAGALLTKVTVAEAFDDRTGWVAAVLLVASPLFFIQAAVFLPYVPTLVWTLAFAAAYFRADRTGSHRLAAVAGLALGVAVFARPYTTVLVGAPFVVHAVWTMRGLARETITRQALTAAGGLLGVAVALSYNAYVTGDPLVFPYEAFAPRDGLGFGRREIAGFSRVYTPALAARATLQSLWLLAREWFVAGLVGTALALGGFGVALRRGIDGRQATLAAVAPSVTLGYAYFWGPMNALGELDRAGDGLAATLGPYYHVSLLLPATGLAAVGLLAARGWIRRIATARYDGARARRAVAVGLLVGGAALGGAGVATAAAPIADNAAVSDQLGAAYEPLEDRSYDDAVVFLPTPYGDWLNHPFQKLRNDPDYDEGPIYALREHQFAVLDAFPGRSAYRYTYRGIWAPTAGEPVTSRVQPVDVAEGDRVVHEFGLSVPASAERVAFRLATDGDQGYASVATDGRSTVRPTLAVDADRAVLTVADRRASVPLGDRDAVELRALVDYGTGAGYDYVIEVPTETDADGVRTLTPSVEVCREAVTCDGEAAYVPGEHADYVRVEQSVSVEN
jgi:hypothetical protein